MKQVYNNLVALLKHDISASKRVLIIQNDNSPSDLVQGYFQFMQLKLIEQSNFAPNYLNSSLCNRLTVYTVLRLQNKLVGVYYRIFVYEIRNCNT